MIACISASFENKLLSVVVKTDAEFSNKNIMITKGALESIIEVCDSYEKSDESIGSQIGLDPEKIMLGEELDSYSVSQLDKKVLDIDIFVATSANFGNMFSMAGASLFLKFLPLLPKQILLTNLLTDFPSLQIASALPIKAFASLLTISFVYAVVAELLKKRFYRHNSFSRK